MLAITQRPPQPEEDEHLPPIEQNQFVSRASPEPPQQTSRPETADHVDSTAATEEEEISEDIATQEPTVVVDRNVVEDIVVADAVVEETTTVKRNVVDETGVDQTSVEETLVEQSETKEDKEPSVVEEIQVTKTGPLFCSRVCLDTDGLLVGSMIKYRLTEDDKTFRRYRSRRLKKKWKLDIKHWLKRVRLKEV